MAATDIALELDISPGNLYYHFKGKEIIIPALFDRFQRELAGALSAPLQDPTLFRESLDERETIERCWLFLTVIFELMHDYRFIYQNVNDLMLRFPIIALGMRRLLKLKRGACYSLVGALLPLSVTADEQRVLNVTDGMTLHLTYWLPFEQLTRQDVERTRVIHRGVLQTLTFCAPYLGDAQAHFFKECEALYSVMIQQEQA